MKRVSLLFCIIIGVLLCADAIVLTITTGFSLGNTLVLCLGAVFTLVACYYNKLSPCLKKLTRIVMPIGVSIITAMIVLIVINKRSDNATFTEDCAIVLGAGIRKDKITIPLKTRLDKCLEYVAKNPNAIIIVSGGMGKGESIPEALAMERYLVSKGIDANRIIKDEKAKDTYENMVNSKAILDARFPNGYTTTCITNSFHSYRAHKIGERIGIEVSSYSSNLPFYLWPSTYLREILSMWKFWIYR